MDKMNKIIDETINRNNRSLYDQLMSFIEELNSKQIRFDSQVPTCLILTSSESASSIDQQFHNLSQWLSDKLGCKHIFLDDKKCGNTKSAIQHLIKQVKLAFGVLHEETSKKIVEDPRLIIDSGDDMIV
jgi:hypothetical protein